MDTKNPIVNYPTPPTTSHNFSSLSYSIAKDSGNYPYSYSPLNNCITSTNNSKESTSPKLNMNMNNYNSINMYNTTSIISPNNSNSNLNTPPNNTNNYPQGANNNKITNDSSNFSISSIFQSYPNTNYTTNINPSIQPLSPKEIGSNQPSQQNYINYNTYPNPNANQVKNGPVNNMMNNNNVINENNQKLTIDTSINNAGHDTPTTGNNGTIDIKTPTSVKRGNSKNVKDAVQVNTPPMTPDTEKSKKRRGEHIHYNIKTNMFTETVQYYEVFNYDKTKSFNFRIIPKVDRGFFPTGPERDFTCYRRNYFQVSVSFSADNVKNPIEFNNPCFLKIGNDFFTVRNFYIGISAKVKNSNKEIRVVQQTAKREKGPQNRPAHKLCKPGGNPNYYHGLTSNKSIVTFERLQFKSATPNSSKRIATQQFYALVIELYAETAERKYKIATLESKRLIVRGRSPGHYQNNGFDDPSLLSNKSPEPSYGYYNDGRGFNTANNNNGNFGYDPNQSNYPVFNNASNSNQFQPNYSNDYPYEQNMNFYNPNNGQFASTNTIDRSNSQSAAFPLSYNNGNGNNNNSPYSKSNNNNGMNYQNNPASFYPMKPMEEMYQTPPLPPQQSTQSPYIPSQVHSLFPPQTPSNPPTYPSDNYYAQNPNPNTTQQPPITQNVNNLPQNVNNTNQTYNQDILFANPAQFQAQTPSQTNTNQTTTTPSSSMSTNYTVASWSTNGAF